MSPAGRVSLFLFGIFPNVVAIGDSGARPSDSTTVGRSIRARLRHVGGSSSRAARLDPTTLRQVVERARHHDPDAWESLYRHCYPALYAYAGRRLSPAVADDAVSDALARAIERIDRFEWRGAGFDAWMYGILRNVVKERYRHVTTQALPTDPAQLAQGLVEGEDASTALLARTEAAQIRRAFATLSESDQDLLELRVIAGLSAVETGQLLGKEAGAVRMAQARALDRLRAALRGGLDG